MQRVSRVNTTRGMSFDPTMARIERAAAQALRAAEEQQMRREALRAAKQAHTESMRAHGRMLDQTEICYRQHTPGQHVYVEAQLEDDRAWQDSCYDRLVSDAAS